MENSQRLLITFLVFILLIQKTYIVLQSHLLMRLKLLQTLQIFTIKPIFQYQRGKANVHLR